jgi:chromosomal replication initiator protein
MADFLLGPQTSTPPGNPLLLHGPPGTGKTHLASALAEQVTRERPELTVFHLPASDLVGNQNNQTTSEPDGRSGEQDNVASDEPLVEGEEEELTAVREPAEDAWAAARRCDLLILEDLQHLAAAAVGPLARLIDTLLARGRLLVFTANNGPQQLEHRHGRFSPRLANRLAGGMVVRLDPWQVKTRYRLLRQWTQHLQVEDNALGWLAQHLAGGGRQLLGAVRQLEALADNNAAPLPLALVVEHFAEQPPTGPLTVARIAERVSGYFQVELRQLQSRARTRELLTARQVSMYLVRQLTRLSLEQIGAYFGGRDHSTVLHACRKVEEALTSDAVLCGTVRELQADLG